MTPASDDKPTRRIVLAIDRYSHRSTKYVASIGATSLILRPRGTRVGGPAQIEVPFGVIMTRELLSRAEQKQREKDAAKKAAKKARALKRRAK